MIYLTKGKLPWQGLQGGKDKREKYNMISEKKMSTKIEDLCYELPSIYYCYLNIIVEFALFYSHCRGLEFK